MDGVFNTDTDSDNGLDEERGRDRDSLFLKAEMHFPEQGTHCEARIRNLSAGGLMAEAPVESTRGEPVEVKLRNLGWVFGSVAWATEHRFGIAFNAPIDPKMARKPVGQNNDAISIEHRPGHTRFRTSRTL